MKAIFINSKEKIVHEVELSTNSNSRMAEMYDYIDCQRFEIGKFFENEDVLFVDEEGLLTLTDESMFFSINGEKTLAGNGLIIGREIGDGEMIEDTVTDIDSLNIKFLTLEGVEKNIMNIEIIHESLVNGQRKQMVRQIDEYGSDFWQDYKVFLYNLYDIVSCLQFEDYSDVVISYFRIKEEK